MQTDYKIEVFSKNNCPGCVQVKQLLKNRNLVYTELLVDNPNGRAKMELLLREPSIRTVPQVFINGKLIGGLEELIKELATNDYA